MRTEIGDVITYYSPTGGGYGDPLERDPAKVLDDVLDGFITSTMRATTTASRWRSRRRIRMGARPEGHEGAARGTGAGIVEEKGRGTAWISFAGTASQEDSDGWKGTCITSGTGWPIGRQRDSDGLNGEGAGRRCPLSVSNAKMGD